MSVVRSKDNERVKGWARLARDARERRRTGLAMLEGPHLIETCLERGRKPSCLIVSESGLLSGEIARLVERFGQDPTVLSDAVFRKISDAESPAGISAVIEIPQEKPDCATSQGCLFLDGIQDAGNVGAILRSAAAFAVPDVVLGAGCADPWSPKALRAGMGGHFILRIASSADLAGDVVRFGATTLCTVVHDGEPLESVELSGRIGWIFGSEGAGVAEGIAARSTRRVCIPMPGGGESLNVAAAAAICLYERRRQISTGAVRS